MEGSTEQSGDKETCQSPAVSERFETPALERGKKTRRMRTMLRMFQRQTETRSLQFLVQGTTWERRKAKDVSLL